MFLKKLIERKSLTLTAIFFVTLTLFPSCMTSSRQDELQSSIDKLDNKIINLQNLLNSKDQQINNTTQTVLTSQNDVQSLHDQLQLTQGAVDEIKNRMKKIEENLGANAQNSTSSNEENISTTPDLLSNIQKKVARLELISNALLTNPRKGKMPTKIKNLADLNKHFKSEFDKNNFKIVADLSSTILAARDANDAMLATALEYRGEAKFQMLDYKGAAIDLSTVIELFSNVTRKARALLLAGDSYVYLKNNSVAQLYYQECAKNFATQPEGKAAAARLVNLTAHKTPMPDVQ